MSPESLTNVEAIPLPPDTVNVVISNCVINLSPAARAERGDHVGCIAGALSISEYRADLVCAGFTGIEITPTHQVADGMHSAIIRALKPHLRHQPASPKRTGYSSG